MSASKNTLARARHEAATSLVRLLQSHAEALALLVRALEAKHGVVARSLELRAGEVALAAQRGEMDAQGARATVRRAVYTPEVLEALRNYAAHLRDARMRLAEATRDVGDELAAYGVGVDPAKERTMREIARVYREMSRQADEARNDMQRLGRA